MQTKRLAFTAMFAACICVLAPFVVPIGIIPISLATFAVYMAASLTGWKHGTVAVILYILLGAVGLPVFSGFTGGIQKLVGVTGGYIVGYIPCAMLTGWIIGRHETKVWAYPVAMIAGTAVCYATGLAWFILQTGKAFGAALAICVVPFLPGDAVKIAAASAIAPKLRRIIKKSAP